MLNHHPWIKIQCLILWSQFNMESLPVVTSQRWIMMRRHNSTWNCDLSSLKFVDITDRSDEQWNRYPIATAKPCSNIRNCTVMIIIQQRGLNFFRRWGRNTMTPCLTVSQFDMKKLLNLGHSTVCWITTPRFEYNGVQIQSYTGRERIPLWISCFTLFGLLYALVAVTISQILPWFSRVFTSNVPSVLSGLIIVMQSERYIGNIAKWCKCHHCFFLNSPYSKFPGHDHSKPWCYSYTGIFKGFGYSSRLWLQF